MKIRLFIHQKLASNELLELRKDQSHYLANVMRCREGRDIFIFNPEDGEFRAIYKEKGKLEIIEQTKQPNKENEVTLIFAPIKFGKIDYLVQKATELGATRIQPIQTQHTTVTRINYDRLSANAIEASEQTGRISLPQIDELQSLIKIIDDWDSKKKIIYCDESGNGKSFREVIEAMPKTSKDFALLIGPEGGFSEQEREFLSKKKYIYPAKMGERILRAETAAIAALGAFQAIKGDWS